MKARQSKLWISLEQALHGIHPWGQSRFEISPFELLELHEGFDSNNPQSTYRLTPLDEPYFLFEAVDNMCRVFDEFSHQRSCHIQVDKMEVLDWQAWLEAGLGDFQQPVTVSVIDEPNLRRFRIEAAHGISDHRDRG